MKCPACWAEKAYIRGASSWRDTLLSILLIVPMRCHHCYHSFHVSWFLTIGKRITPPQLRIAPANRVSGPTRTKKPDSTTQTNAKAGEFRPRSHRQEVRRADAA